MEETAKEKAQKDILSWCLLLPDKAIPKVTKRGVKPSIFSDPDDAATFQAMIDLFNRGEAVDLVTVAKELDGKMEYRAQKLVKLIDRPLFKESLYSKFLRKTVKVLSRSVLKDAIGKGA
jgi:replicative DNA helicase